MNLQTRGGLSHFLFWVVIKIHSNFGLLQIPDVRTGKDRVDAVVVDDEIMGSVRGLGCGAKILRGDGALESYLSKTKTKKSLVNFLLFKWKIICVFAKQLWSWKYFGYNIYVCALQVNNVVGSEAEPDDLSSRAISM